MSRRSRAARASVLSSGFKAWFGTISNALFYSIWISPSNVFPLTIRIILQRFNSPAFTTIFSANGRNFEVRKTVFWLHLIAGVSAGCVIFVMSVTGVLLMYQRQITEWADQSRLQAPNNARPLRVETLLGSIKQFETGTPSAVTLSSDPNMAATVTFGRD